MAESLSASNSLNQNGYTTIEIDITKNDLEATLDEYLAFLELDEKYQESTVFYNTDRGDGDFGQNTRVAGKIGLRGTIQDNKDVFHFGGQTRQIVESRISGKLPSDMKAFLNSAEEIFWAGQRSKRLALEELTPDNEQALEVMCSEREIINDVLRFIAYHESTERLAKGHFDRGVLTIAIGESHEGLRIAPGQNGLILDCNEEYMKLLEANLKPVNHDEGQAKLMIGAGWNRLPKDVTGNLDLNLSWHDVIESDQVFSEEIMRWAVVMFCNPHIKYEDYLVPTPPETRPYKQLGSLSLL